MNDLERQMAWGILWLHLNASGDGLTAYRELRMRYQEPHRAYHNLNHIDHCIQELNGSWGCAYHPEAVLYALWYHDAHYDPRIKNNEELSADLAIHVAEVHGLKPSLINRVVRHIMATKHESVPTDPDSQLVVDIDLAILGQTRERFDEYEKQIRQEYSWVPENDYRTGRYKVLSGFLGRPQIYSTRVFQEEYESQARRNIARSLELLVS